MSRKSLTYLLLAILIISISCEEVVDVDLPASQGFIVVEGWITNQNKLQTLTIRKTTGYADSTAFIPIKNAKVIVKTSNDSTYFYKHKESGSYQSELPFEGKKDVKYQLKITFPNGMKAFSSWEKMGVKTSIMDATIEESSVFLSTTDTEPTKIKFPRLIAKDDKNTTDYYQWKSYTNGKKSKVISEPIALRSDIYFNGATIPNDFSNTIYPEKSTARIELIKIPKSAYRFLSAISTQISLPENSSNFPFTNVKGNISTNIDSVSVLGYFGTAAISSYSIIIK